MKKITASLLFVIVSAILFAQNVKKIENLKDGWGLSYTYTGEVKDGKPNGMGVAKYKSGNVVRYVGSFVNGMYSGKGTMFFDNGAFLTGEWKNGKLNGKGSNLNADGSLFIGDFADGVRNGKGVLFLKNNSVVIGRFMNDKMNGRCINIWEDGTIISDIQYYDDKRNGPGLQYEAKAKKLYEGEWKNDQWSQAATIPFSSFLKTARFVGEATSDHVLIGPTNTSNFLIDSSYYYDLINHKRFFGTYVDGHLRDGLIIRDDSTRFLGPLNEKGASGYCYDFKFGKYYSEGNYIDDYLSGQILDIDLEKKSVYYGNAQNGVFTGKAYFFNEKGTMYAGDYVKGRFTGKGYKFETTGTYTSGTWENGDVTSLEKIITEDGEMINGMPKTFGEAINSIIKDYPVSSFDHLSGEFLDEYEDIEEDLGLDTAYLDYSNSLLKIPGSIGNNATTTDFDAISLYYARMLETTDFSKAKAKYNELATQLVSFVISNKKISGNKKLAGKVIAPNLNEELTETEFTIPGEEDDYMNFKVWLRLHKTRDGKYIVSLVLGEKEED